MLEDMKILIQIILVHNGCVRLDLSLHVQLDMSHHTLVRKYMLMIFRYLFTG
jgi:hypothetical protein